ncbi:hypothetical protein JCM15764A_01810 [Geotalea toluenoxydans]
MKGFVFHFRLWPSGEAVVAGPTRFPGVTSQHNVTIDGRLHVSVGTKNINEVTKMKQNTFKKLVAKTVRKAARCTSTVALLGSLASAPLTKA